jgi:WD40 repeat protein
MTSLAAPGKPAGPYPGLRPFRREESLIFFGRDGQVDGLASRLGRSRPEPSRFLAVVGSSGCGKSSLVRAGLIPRLNSSLTIDPGRKWRVTILRPGGEPMRNLAAALLGDEALRAAWGDSPDPAAALAASVARGPRGLSEALDGLDFWGDENLLLVVDQFEEVFRFRREGRQDEADAFVALLLATAAAPWPPVYVVQTMRSDYVGDCDLFPGLPEQLNEGQFYVPRLTLAQCREAVEGPAGVFDAELEPELVERVLHDMATVPDPLPLMQHALMRLWIASGAASGSVLTLDAYYRIGGVAGALNQHAEEEFRKLDEGQKRTCQVLFRRLCERGADRRDIRRPTPLGEVAEVAGVPVESVYEVADVYRAPELSVLMPPPPAPLEPGTVLDITHEALIRQWKRLRRWVTREARSAEHYLRLDSSAARKEEKKAAFLVSPELEITLAWKAKARPNPAWARRYGGDFDRAMKFLETSAERARRRKEKKAEAERERQLTAERLARESERREAADLLLAETRAREEAEAARAREADRRAKESARAEARIRGYFYATSVSLVWISLLLGVALWLAYEATRQSRRAKSATEDAKAQGERAERQARIANAQWLTLQAQSAFTSDPRLGLLLAVEAVKAAAALGESGSPSAEQVLAERVLRQVVGATGWSEVLTDTSGKPDNAVPVAVSPDLKKLITKTDPGSFEYGEGKVDVWERRSGSPAGRLPLKTLGNYVAVALDVPGRRLAASRYEAVNLWSIDRLDVKPAPLTVVQGIPRILMFSPRILMFSPDGRRLAAAGAQGEALLWDPDRLGEPPRVIRPAGQAAAVTALAFAPRESRLLTGHEDGTVRIWDLSRPESPYDVKKDEKDAVTALAVSPDGLYFAQGTSGGSVRYKEIDEVLGPLSVLNGPGPITGLAFNPDGLRLAASRGDGSLVILHLGTSGDAPQFCRGHVGRFTLVQVAADQQRFVTGGVDGVVRLWDWNVTSNAPENLGGSLGDARSVVFSPDGSELLAAGQSGVTRWSVRDRPSRVERSNVPAQFISPDGRRFLRLTLESIGLSEMARPTESIDLRGVEPQLPQLVVAAFSPDGRRLATSGSEGTTQL